LGMRHQHFAKQTVILDGRGFLIAGFGTEVFVSVEKGLGIMLKIKLRSKVLTGLVLGLSMFASSFAMTADNTGMVVASRGDVTAEIGGELRILKQGDDIFVTDEITTGDKSFAVLQFVDGAKVTVRPNSAIIIEDYVYNGTDEDVATLSLVSGGLRVITGAMAKSNPENYKVRTPVALMGVRGTEFAVMLCGDQLCADGNLEE